MDSLTQLTSQLSEVEDRLCYTFKNKQLLLLACVHRSFYNERRDSIEAHNERLEFLGDSVLGLLIAEYLYRQLPQEPEGRLSSLRAQIVESGSCMTLVSKLQLTNAILLGRGERMNAGRGRETILADFFEALIGAIYLDGGLEITRKFFFQHFSHELQERLRTPSRNWKAELQDYSQKKYQKPPQYHLLKTEGPDHHKQFHITVHVDDKPIGQGIGNTKKEAEQDAAQHALLQLEK